MTKRRFLHIDGHNLFHRQVNMTPPNQGVDTMVGMAFHLIFNSMKKEYNKWNGNHTMFYLEGKSWRKDIYPQYKANRALAFSAKTEKEQEDFAIVLDAYNDLTTYLTEKTNISVIRNPSAEADDMIYICIEAHPDDEHILVSSDSDFYQLLRMPNVKLYDPIKDILLTQDGIFDDDGNRLSFTITSGAKVKVGKKDPDFVAPDKWYEYALFMKLVRGDKTDNIFSAYPKVREKGTKNSVGILEAYADMETKGYSWNNFMNQKFVHHDGGERVVRDLFELNRRLIDLSMIPDHVKSPSLEIISQATTKSVPSVEIGTGFLKFCGKWDLKKIGDAAPKFMPMLKAKYDQ